MKNPPKSWSELTWQQLCDCWQVKIRYGGTPDVARAAALMALCGLSYESYGSYKTYEPHKPYKFYSPITGERQFLLRSADGIPHVVTPRELAYYAKQAIPWFDFPYGDGGEEEQKDEKGKVIKERREPVRGYVNPVGDWHDALELPREYIVVHFRHFALPKVACYNLTWEQYRTLQNIASNLFTEGMSDVEALDWQAQFLAHCLTPRSFAILDTAGGSIRLRPHWEYAYNSERANGMVSFWRRALSPLPRNGEGFAPLKWLRRNRPSITGRVGDGYVLFHICFQAYQTAVANYYATAYPLLFGGGKSDTLTDALKGESRTVNAIMKYAGYTEQQQVYDSNLSFILDYLNAMTEEAKEIEKINSKVRKKT